MVSLSGEFVKTIKSTFKEDGISWLASFDELIRYCERNWSLHILEPFALSYNFVAPAILQDRTEVVVKLSVPSNDYRNEVKALRYFNGNGIVKVLDYEIDRGIMILEHLKPGNTLDTISNNEKATHIAANVVQALWIPAPANSGLPEVKDRENELQLLLQKHPNGLGPITKQLFAEAITVYQRLNNTTTEKYLLHGDMHHYNILSVYNHTWKAIDPKGLIGEREYDLTQYMLNVLPEKNKAEVIASRVHIFAEKLNLNKERILAWSYCHAILATAWTMEDDTDYNQDFLETISILKDLYEKEYGPIID